MKNDEKSFGKLMALLETVFPQGADVSKKKIDLYYEMLSDIPIDNIRANIQVLVNTRKYPTFPTIAEIRQPLTDSDRKIETEQAWLQVIEKIRDVGHWKSVTFDDPCIMKAIEAMGGWERVAMVDIKDTKWLRMEFEKVYASVSPVDAPLSLPGAFETINEEKTAARTKALADERAKALPCPVSVKQELARRREESE